MTFKKRCILFILLSVFTIIARASTPIHMMNVNIPDIAFQQIKNELRAYYNLNTFSEIKLQLIYDKKNHPDHFIVYLFHKNRHSLTSARINTDRYYRWLSLEKNYQPTSEDIAHQPGKKWHEAVCPDHGIEFVTLYLNLSLKID